MCPDSFKLGQQSVRVLVREAEIGRLSAVTRSLRSPDYTSRQLTVSGPVLVDHLHPGLIMRGLDGSSPPDRRSGGPVTYPYRVGGSELTPMARFDAAPGSVVQLFAVADNLSRHPFTGQPQFAVVVALERASGRARQLDDVDLIGRYLDPRSGAAQLILNVQMPADVEPGMRRLILSVIDQIAGVTAQAGLSMWIGGEGHAP